MASYLFFNLVCLMGLLMATAVRGDANLTFTFVDSAVAKGAVCLDGSAPAYAHLEGYGDGAESWLVYIQEGAWCGSTDECFNRTFTGVGSSRFYRVQNLTASGILDTNRTINPDFYNWHKVFVVYCDGSSFMSNVTDPIPTQPPIYYRGARIFAAVIEDLLSKGMRTAKNAILAGKSAGGLTTTLHCDLFKSYIPLPDARVKCISDSGFIIHAKDQPGATYREKKFADIVATHRLADLLPKSCTSKVDPNLCLFPEYFVGDIQTPLFIVDSVFDLYQIEYNLGPALGGNWSNCVKNCNFTQLQITNGFRTSFINTLENIIQSPTRGIFVSACYCHVFTFTQDRWRYPSVLSNKTIEQAVGDWFYDRSPFQEIDTKDEFPLNCIFP